MAKEKVAIIGDSFAADGGPDSWITMLARDYDVINYSQRGISQYRLYCLVEKNIVEIDQADHVILFHTSPLRVYIPDQVDYPTRQLASHATCDMIANDVMSSSWNKFADIYYRLFFDEQQQQTFYRLLVSDITRLTKHAIHCSGFTNTNLQLNSFADIRELHPGNINHFDFNGNVIVYNSIKELLC